MAQALLVSDDSSIRYDRLAFLAAELRRASEFALL
ncbi:hypothetical protein PENANT_c011G09849 [Penicillium antarcticum]|uniref:Uncharacterized protein n=1 Tax=Penicillium antarcticum TaxID=416450 RepID=A0A1V6Q795_9EURO|nr:hypothetical protein PENANT_c011G09849 [Penicillium antarcticum]